jgi:hypothetical protein
VAFQRLSDWSKGKSLPRQFESIEPAIWVLIDKAIRRKTPPAIPGLYELGQWRKWWSEARTASDDKTDQPPQIPSPACPYQGLAAFGTTDSARFFGRTRSTDALVAFITKVRATDPGIVLLTGPSGARSLRRQAMTAPRDFGICSIQRIRWRWDSRWPTPVAG